jgi:hypothetical protein
MWRRLWPQPNKSRMLPVACGSTFSGSASRMASGVRMQRVPKARDEITVPVAASLLFWACAGSAVSGRDLNSDSTASSSRPDVAIKRFCCSNSTSTSAKERYPRVLRRRNSNPIPYFSRTAFTSAMRESTMHWLGAALRFLCPPRTGSRSQRSSHPARDYEACRGTACHRRAKV